MDFGTLMGIDAFLNSSSIHGADIFSSSTTTTSSDTDNRSLFFESGVSIEQGRSADWRSFKMAKTEALPSPLPYEQQLLGFSSFGVPAPSSTAHVGNGGTCAPCQRMELEHQTLICTYVDANAAPPSDLPIPMRRSCFNPLSTASSPSCAYARLCGNADAEAGRCRRTDGKKWRCSRNAVAEHKYCERHLNRGRHRSRKPVEGHIRKASHLTQHRMSSNQQPSTASSSTAVLNRTTISKAKVNTCQPTLLNSKITGTEFPNPKQNQIGKFFSDIDFGFISIPWSTLGPSSSNLIISSNIFPGLRLKACNNSKLSTSRAPEFSSCSSSSVGMSQRQESWIPFNWDSCAGGPLAEALMNTCKTSSSWDLMMDNWTPSTTFHSVSDSTTSSPKHKTNGSISSVLPHDFLANSPATPKASRYLSPLT